MPRADSRRRSERGVALVMTMMLTGLLTALGLSVALLTTVETWLSASQRTSQELAYAAEAALARVEIDLSASADWSATLGGAVPGGASAFNDRRTAVTLADASSVDLLSVTRTLQAEADARCGARASDPDCPEWQLFAHAPLSALASDGVIASPVYVAAWIADDPFDKDGDPAADTNGRLLVRAQAFGAGGARRTVEAVVGRAAPAGVRLLSWRELR
jgi:hypothetical protein